MVVNIKLIIKLLIGFVSLIIFTCYVISYANFNFEIPFLTRTNPNSVSPDTALDLNSASDASTETTEDINNIHGIVNPDDLIYRTEQSELDNTISEDNSHNSQSEDRTESSTVPLFPDVSELKEQGFSVSDGVYEKYTPENQESPQLYEYAFGVVVPEYRNISKSLTVTAGSGALKVVEPFMDFILMRQSGNIILCDSSGKIISENFAASGFKILKERDINNNTIFSHTEDAPSDIGAENEEGGESGQEVNTVTRHYIYDPGTKSLLQTYHNPIYGDRGVPFMYPSYYGANKSNNLSRYSVDGKWGYMFSDTEAPAIYPEYDMAYNFSDDIGIAYKTEQKGLKSNPYFYKRLYFLDGQGRAFKSDYFAPDEVTYEHLGFFYFEKGLTRAYYREFDWQGQTTVERDIIVDKNGTEFYIPEDYTIRAYSNGVILLEKNGLYGFMSYTGNWIAQPIFTYAQPFREGLAVLGFTDGKKALIDTQGNLIVKFQYDYISNCVGGTIALYEENQGWSILSKMIKIAGN